MIRPNIIPTTHDPVDWLAFFLPGRVIFILILLEEILKIKLRRKEYFN